MLEFDGNWRFDPPCEIPEELIWEFDSLIGRVATQGDRQYWLEHFKWYFAKAAGTVSVQSTSATWAESDLTNFMRQAASNAPLFIEAFYDACEAAREEGVGAPTVAQMNRRLFEHGTGWEIQPPRLLLRSAPDRPTIEVPNAPSLDEQAMATVHASWTKADKHLATGEHRAAVQEVLWLLETVSTAFNGVAAGDGTVQGKYFNKIVEDLRRRLKGTTLERVLEWMVQLHGYLSSPTGGGIRHGADLSSSVPIQEHEARLFFNLIRSYITYLIEQHEVMTGTRRVLGSDVPEGDEW